LEHHAASIARSTIETLVPVPGGKHPPERALPLIADGSIRPVIFPFEEAAAAHTLIEDRKAVGKTLLLHPSR
jgi:hypothetical protein